MRTRKACVTSPHVPSRPALPTTLNLSPCPPPLPAPQNRLAGLQQDFTSTANQASSGIFSFFGLGGRKQQQPAEPAVSPAPSASSSGGRKSGDK